MQYEPLSHTDAYAAETFENIAAKGEIVNNEQYTDNNSFDFTFKKTLQMVAISALLGAQGCGVSIMTDWLVSG